MKPKLTLLALLVAGAINLQAQQPTANESAWRALVAEKKTEAAASPEALAIKDSILAGDTITRTEIFAVANIAKAHGGDAAYGTAFRTIAGSNKSGAGVSLARACVKFWEGDMSGWTEDVIAARLDLAATLANRPGATPQLKADVWKVFTNRSAHNCRPFFKAHRSTLPKAAQIEATQRQKELLLAIPTRDASANAWLAEISADLVALQLDQ